MTAAAARPKSLPTAAPAPEKAAPKPISWTDFERKYLSREDRYKYEWVEGFIIKTLRTMNQEQQFMLLNLEALLDRLRPSNPALGKLLAEVDTFFGENHHRRPDIAYFSIEQIKAFRQTNQIPLFVVEVISTYDQQCKAYQKLADYRRAEVPVVWHVFPKLQEVHVYRGKQMTICTGEDSCSAEPVIPGFVLPVGAVFR